MRPTKEEINQQIRRASELIDGRGREKEHRMGIRAALKTEFGLSNRQAARRIHQAIYSSAEHRVETREDQVTRTLRQLDRMIESDETPATTRLAAIKQRISLLGLEPDKEGATVRLPQQALYPADTSVSNAQARDQAVARAREKATDNTDEKGESNEKRPAAV